MKVNWAERLMVNSPVRVLAQRLIVKWIGRSLAPDPKARSWKGVGRPGGRGLPHPEEIPARGCCTPWTWTTA